MCLPFWFTRTKVNKAPEEGGSTPFLLAGSLLHPFLTHELDICKGPHGVLMVGLSDLSGLFQPSRFCGSMILWLSALCQSLHWHPGFTISDCPHTYFHIHLHLLMWHAADVIFELYLKDLQSLWLLEGKVRRVNECPWALPGDKDTTAQPAWGHWGMAHAGRMGSYREKWCSASWRG